MLEQKITFQMEECRILAAFVSDFLNDNRGNRYGKYLTDSFMREVAEGIRRIDTKFIALQDLKMGKNDAIVPKSKEITNA